VEVVRLTRCLLHSSLHFCCLLYQGQGVSDWTRAPETFYLDNANFNWSADPQGVYFAKAAAEYGVPHIAAFVNSAPTPFTSNGKNCGGSFVKGMENAYAKYLVDVISHFREDGIPINLISPMNEPTSAFGNGTDCRQEGMAVHPLERAAMIEALHTELERKELEETVGIIADESNMIKKAMVEDIAWLPRVQKLIVAVAHHT
jgi:O-glycosyl hydrolase